MLANVNSRYPNSVNFKSQLKPVTEPIENKKEQKLSTTAKVAIGTGLIALAAAGIYLATKGKVKIKPAAGSETLTKDINLAEFKNISKQQKGEAVLNNGEKFTGTISYTANSGKNVSLEYLNGKLIQSKSSGYSYEPAMGNAFETNIVKKYSYSDTGKLQKIESKVYKPDNGLQLEEGYLKRSVIDGRNIIEIKRPDKAYSRTKTIFSLPGKKDLDFIVDAGSELKYTKFVDGKPSFMMKGNSFIEKTKTRVETPKETRKFVGESKYAQFASVPGEQNIYAIFGRDSLPQFQYSPKKAYHFSFTKGKKDLCQVYDEKLDKYVDVTDAKEIEQLKNKLREQMTEYANMIRTNIKYRNNGTYTPEPDKNWFDNILVKDIFDCFKNI